MTVYMNRVATRYLRRRARKKALPVLLLFVVILASGFTGNDNDRETKARMASWTPTPAVCTVAWADPPMYGRGE